MKLAACLCFILITCGLAGGQTPTPTPAEIREQVVVTANRTEIRIGDTPASVVTFSRREITDSAGPVIDDVLRQAVGFSIFRRSSSRNANPTTQGVSLRGVGSSGASRSAVMFDGVPLNDPFGGWVAWSRVPPIEVELIEVLRGGASSLYGDSGLSGAVNLIARRPDGKLSFSGDLYGGTRATASGAGWLGFTAGSWSGSLTAANFQTRGFKPVDEPVRGPIDSFAGSRSSTFSGRFERKFGPHSTVFVRPSYFGEVRSNGTGLQTNRTHIRQLAAGGETGLGPKQAIRIGWRVYGGTQVYDQVFSAVTATRTAESLTRVQRVPVQNIGFTAQISAVYREHTFVGGVEARNVRGASDETAYIGNQSFTLIGAGGRQRTIGAFVQDFIKVGPKLIVVVGLRADRWKNYAALRATRTLSTNQAGATIFPDRDESALSPRGSVLYHLSNRIALYASASRSFRAPTLNELYRSFRVGNVSTLANENLRAERASNVEGGVTFGQKRTFLRASGFWTSIDQPVANVTLATTPTLITRQRQNAGKTRSAGIELEGETRFKSLTLSAGYLFAASTVVSFPANPVLVGLAVPQVARHQFTFQAAYARKRWTLAIQGRASGRQFDDDLNQFRLEPYARIDVFASRQLNENLRIYAAIENIFNSQYSVGRTPIRTVASPANLRVGLRWK